jgi:NAD(P)-dependent dehydrogenase (short-subunit alcohol dehydrogenase family)
LAAGWAARPGFGAYTATKFALEGYSEALALEIAHLGIVAEVDRYRRETDGAQPGGPAKAAPLLAIIRAEQPRRRLPLGNDAVDRIRDKLAEVERSTRDWETLSRSTEYS